MAFGQLPVPVNPEDLLMAQQMGGAAPAQQPQQLAPQLMPIQAGGTTAFINPTTGEMTAPNITTTTEKSPSSASTKVPETPKIKAAEADISQTRAMAEEAARKQTMVAIQEREFRAEAAERENELLKQQQAEREAARKDQDARVSAELAALRERQADQANFKPQTFGESMGTFRSALAAIGMGLGAWGASRGGGPNTAFDVFKAGEAAHREKQREIIDQKAAAIAQAGGNLKAAQDYRAKALADIDEKYLAKNKVMQGLIEAKIKRIPKAEADGQVALASLRKDYGEKEMEIAQKLAGTRTDQSAERSVSTTEGKPTAGGNAQPTQYDKTLALHGNIMDRAINEMETSPPPSKEALAKAQDNQALLLAAVNEAKTTGGAVKQILLRKFELTPRFTGEGIKPKDQIYINNANRVNTSFLRITSGAAIKDDEFIRQADELLLQPGESPEVSAWKMKQMRAIAQDVGALSGKAGRELDAATAKTEAAEKPTSEPRVSPSGQTPAQKQYTSETTKQIAQDKRDFASERKTMSEATRLMKRKDLSSTDKAALEWARKNPSDPRASAIIKKNGGK